MAARCERCRRFGAEKVWVVGEKLPRTPSERWVYNQRVRDAYLYGEYGQIVEVSDGPVAGYESFQVYLCPSCQEMGRLIIGGRRDRCDSCGRVRYGMGNNFEHVCEDCALAQLKLESEW
jgi:hypothetical protein